MGTTMTVALVENGGVTFGHVGDSRAYVLRDGELEQLTDDHSLVAELVRRRQALRRGGRAPPAALGDHARARHRPRRRRRHVHRRGARGRRLRALLRRADRHGCRRGDRRSAFRSGAGASGTPRTSSAPPREQGRRPGQHHRVSVRADRRAGGAGRTDARAHGRADRRGRAPDCYKTDRCSRVARMRCATSRAKTGRFILLAGRMGHGGG